MIAQRGLAPLVLLLVLVVIVLLGAGVFFLLRERGQQRQQTPDGAPPTAVGLTEQFENPFSEESNYVNPLADYKNPFAVAE